MNICADDFFRATADPTRLRCLVLLQREGELCVCEITHALDLAQPKVSRHLALLREAGVVLDRKDGLWVHYRVHPRLPQWARSVLRATAKGVMEQSPYAQDAKALAGMPNRPGRQCCA